MKTNNPEFGFNSDRTIRQYAHGLLLETPFVPSSTDCWAIRAKIRQKRPSWWPQRRNRKQKYNGDPKNQLFDPGFLYTPSGSFFAKTYHFATVQNVTDRQTTDRPTTQCTKGSLTQHHQLCGQFDIGSTMNLSCWCSCAQFTVNLYTVV